MSTATDAQEVADALAITLDRQDPHGAPWCPPNDGVVLRRWVSSRDANLGGGIRRAVRLAHLMAVADGRSYMDFLYVRLTALRARQFRSQLQAAAVGGRLPASIAGLTDAGVAIRSPVPAAAQDGPPHFEIDFMQMPRLAALLDFLHNALGFAAVDDLLSPLVRSRSPDRASDVARSLHSALNAWLGARLESATHLQQARKMRAFLGRQGRVDAGAIGNETILQFWMSNAIAGDGETVDGFRLFTSAASAMLRYRQALRDAAAESQLEASLGAGHDAIGDVAHDGSAEPDAVADVWQSPLRALCSPPANRVKWLTRKEQASLRSFLGGPSVDDDEQDEPTQADGLIGWQGGLAGDERFGLEFCLTLLRADVFGAAQASIVARLRKRSVPDVAIEQAMALLTPASYTECATRYSDVEAQLHLESLAALATLMESGAAEAAILLNHHGGREAVVAVVGSAAGDAPPGDPDDDVAGAVYRLVTPVLRAAIADPSLVPAGTARELVLRARASARRVNRNGFRREELEDAAAHDALRASVGTAVDVIRELQRLSGPLSGAALAANLAVDRSHFLATFQKIYLDNAQP